MAPDTPQRSTQKGRAMSVGQHTILIVDDTPANLEVIADCLQAFGYRVLVAEDGATGLDIARRAQPDLILLDVLMPEMDGFETCRHLKADEQTCSIAVIFMTGLIEEGQRIAGIEAGGADFISKPVGIDELLQRVSRYV